MKKTQPKEEKNIPKPSAKQQTAKATDKSRKGSSMIDESKSGSTAHTTGSAKDASSGTAQLLNNIHTSLGNARSTLGDALRQSANESKQRLELLKSPEVIALGNRDPQTKQQLAQLEIDTNKRLKQLDATHREQEQIFDLAMKDLDEFFGKL